MAESKPEKFIRETATSMPEVEVGAVCDKVAFKAGKKNFLFLGSDGESYDVKLKLRTHWPRPKTCLQAKRGRFPSAQVAGWNWSSRNTNRCRRRF